MEPKIIIVDEIKWFSQKELLNAIKLHPKNFIDNIHQNILKVLDEFNKI